MSDSTFVAAKLLAIVCGKTPQYHEENTSLHRSLQPFPLELIMHVRVGLDHGHGGLTIATWSELGQIINHINKVVSQVGRLP